MDPSYDPEASFEARLQEAEERRREQQRAVEAVEQELRELEGDDIDELDGTKLKKNGIAVNLNADFQGLHLGDDGFEEDENNFGEDVEMSLDESIDEEPFLGPLQLLPDVASDQMHLDDAIMQVAPHLGEEVYVYLGPRRRNEAVTDEDGRIRDAGEGGLTDQYAFSDAIVAEPEAAAGKSPAAEKAAGKRGGSPGPKKPAVGSASKQSVSTTSGTIIDPEEPCFAPGWYLARVTGVEESLIRISWASPELEHSQMLREILIDRLAWQPAVPTLSSASSGRTRKSTRTSNKGTESDSLSRFRDVELMLHQLCCYLTVTDKTMLAAEEEAAVMDAKVRLQRAKSMTNNNVESGKSGQKKDLKAQKSLTADDDDLLAGLLDKKPSAKRRKMEEEQKPKGKVIAKTNGKKEEGAKGEAGDNEYEEDSFLANSDDEEEEGEDDDLDSPASAGDDGDAAGENPRLPYVPSITDYGPQLLAISHQVDYTTSTPIEDRDYYDVQLFGCQPVLRRLDELTITANGTNGINEKGPNPASSPFPPDEGMTPGGMTTDQAAQAEAMAFVNQQDGFGAPAAPEEVVDTGATPNLAAFDEATDINMRIGADAEASAESEDKIAAFGLSLDNVAELMPYPYKKRFLPRECTPRERAEIDFAHRFWRSSRQQLRTLPRISPEIDEFWGVQQQLRSYFKKHYNNDKFWSDWGDAVLPDDDRRRRISIGGKRGLKVLQKPIKRCFSLKGRQITGNGTRIRFAHPAQIAEPFNEDSNMEVEGADGPEVHSIGSTPLETVKTKDGSAVTAAELRSLLAGKTDSEFEVPCWKLSEDFCKTHQVPAPLQDFVKRVYAIWDPAEVIWYRRGLFSAALSAVESNGSTSSTDFGLFTIFARGPQESIGDYTGKCMSPDAFDELLDSEDLDTAKIKANALLYENDLVRFVIDPCWGDAAGPDRRWQPLTCLQHPPEGSVANCEVVAVTADNSSRNWRGRSEARTWENHSARVFTTLPVLPMGQLFIHKGPGGAGKDQRNSAAYFGILERGTHFQPLAASASQAEQSSKQYKVPSEKRAQGLWCSQEDLIAKLYTEELQKISPTFDGDVHECALSIALLRAQQLVDQDAQEKLADIPKSTSAADDSEPAKIGEQSSALLDTNPLVASEKRQGGSAAELLSELGLVNQRDPNTVIGSTGGNVNLNP